MHILQEKLRKCAGKAYKSAGQESESSSAKGRQKGAILTRMHAQRLEMERRGLLVDDQLFNGGKSDNAQEGTTLLFRARLPINRRSHEEQRYTTRVPQVLKFTHTSSLRNRSRKP